MGATFYPNPDPDESELWIEKAAFEGSTFRIWHMMFFCFSGFLSLLILVCCCVKFRIPRTKQEIEADYRRKKLAEKFRERLRMIHNQDMDAIDLKRALEIIQEDYKTETKNIDDRISIQVYPPADSNIPSEKTSAKRYNMAAEPQQPAVRGFILYKIANVFTNQRHF